MNTACPSKLLSDFILKTKRDGGLTYDFKSKEYVEPQDYWYFPKYPGLTQIVNKEDLSDSLIKFLEKNFGHLIEPDIVFGTWINTKTNRVYLDANTFVDDKQVVLNKAKEYSHKDGREIVSMFDPIQGKTEYIEH